MKKFSTLAAAAALALTGVAAPALAQTAVEVGAKVFGPDGSEVGTVEKVEGGDVVLNTGNLTAVLPADVFGTGDNGPTIGWNKADLEAAITAANDEAKAKAEAAVVAGAEIYSVDGVLLGKIKEVTTDGLAVVDLATGPASLPKAQITLQDEKLTFLAKAADIEAAAKAAAGAAAPTEAQGGD